MRLNINDVYVMLGTFIFYILILLGIKKFHIVEEYRSLSRKEKGISMCLVLILVAIVTVVISANNGFSVPTDGKVGLCIGDFAEKLYNNNNTMILLMKYVIVQIPAFIILIMAISSIAQWCGIGILPIYYIALFVVANRGTYRMIRGSWEEAMIIMLFAVVLLGIADCLNNAFTKKKILFLVILAIGVVGLVMTLDNISLQSVRLCIEVGVEGIFMGIIVKYGQYLRRWLRKITKLLYIVLIVYINVKLF